MTAKAPAQMLEVILAEEGIGPPSTIWPRIRPGTSAAVCTLT
jgi:hypothetical protein